MNLGDIKSVIVIGAGGTGSILLPQLARFLRSQKFTGQLIIVDGDNYSESNAERQIFALSKMGMNKAEYQALAITSQLPDFSDKIEFWDEYLDKEKIDELIEEDCVIFNCVDNKAARKYVEDKCKTLNNVAHICCGNEMSTGQVQVSFRQDGKQITPDIYQRSPNFNSTNDDRAAMDCQELAELPSGGQLIAANMMSASLALNYMIQLTTGLGVASGMSSFNCYTNKIQNLDEVKLLD